MIMGIEKNCKENLSQDLRKATLKGEKNDKISNTCKSTTLEVKKGG